MSRTRASLTAAAVLAALALGACSDDDPKPKFDPTPSVAPESPATTDGSTPPDSGTGDFVRSYFEAIAAATTSGDTSQFVSRSGPGCQNCKVLASNIESAFANGGHVEGAGWTIRSIDRQGPQAGGEVWNVDVSTSRERWFNGSGKLVKVVKPSTQRFAVLITAHGAESKVSDMRLRS